MLSLILTLMWAGTASANCVAEVSQLHSPAAYPNICKQRAIHILCGDKTGGGHKNPALANTKSQFPNSWTLVDVLNAVQESIDLPATIDQAYPANKIIFVINKEKNGVTVPKIKIVVRIADNQVITAYPVKK